MLIDVLLEPAECGHPGMVVSIRVIVIKIMDAIPLDPTAIVFNDRAGNPLMTTIIELTNHLQIGTWTGFARQASEDHRGVIAIVAKELVELSLERW